ncbi:hypothetical protein E4T39_01557 [Aureobasidium subglaciale]|nr:hypothetical protein E4T39_01557 [Aureobasidium subglaciale]
MKRIALCAVGLLATLVVAPPPPIDLDHNDARIITTVQSAQAQLRGIDVPSIIDGSLESTIREVAASTDLEAGHHSDCDSDSDAEDDTEAWGHCMKVCKWKSAAWLTSIPVFTPLVAVPVTGVSMLKCKRKCKSLCCSSPKCREKKGKFYGDECPKEYNLKSGLFKQENLAMHRRDEDSATTTKLSDDDQTELDASIYDVENDDMVLDKASINEANTNIDFGEPGSDGEGEDNNDQVENYEDENYMVTNDPIDHDMDYTEAKIDESSMPEANINDVNDANTFDIPPDGIDIGSSSNLVNLDKRWTYHCDDGMKSCLKDCHLKAYVILAFAISSVSGTKEQLTQHRRLVMIPPLIPWRWVRCKGKCEEVCAQVDEEDKKEDEPENEHDSDEEHEPKSKRPNKEKEGKKEEKEKNEEDDDDDSANIDVQTPSGLVTLDKRTDCEKGYDKCLKSCHAWSFAWPALLIGWRWKKCPTKCAQACQDFEIEQQEQKEEQTGEPPVGEPIQEGKGGNKQKKEKNKEHDNQKHKVEIPPVNNVYTTFSVLDNSN